MKNTFRFMGLALLACTLMFTSCKKGLFTVNVTVNNSQYGTVTGAGEYANNTQCTLTATANQYYKFVKWSDGDTTNPRIITVTKGVDLTAIFGNNGRVSFDYKDTTTDGTNWIPTYFSAGLDQASDEFVYLLYEDRDNSATTPHVYIVGPKEEGCYPYNVGDEDYDYFWYYYTNDNDVFEYSEQPTKELYPVWQTEKMEITIKSIDLNANIVSFDAHGKVYNAPKFIQPQSIDDIRNLFVTVDSKFLKASFSKGAANGDAVVATRPLKK